jgi:hypothetical protein
MLTPYSPKGQEMDRDELEKLREKAVTAAHETYEPSCEYGLDDEDMWNAIRAALTIAEPIIRAEAFEEAAKVADEWGGVGSTSWVVIAREGIARRIRSLTGSMVSTGEG